MNLLIRLVINAIALFAASYIVDGVNFTGEGYGSIFMVALIFGLVNAFIRPIALIFSFPALILSLGLFTLVINAIMLYLTAYFSSNFSVEGFGAAFFGAIVISLVSWLLSSFLSDKEKKR